MKQKFRTKVQKQIVNFIDLFNSVELDVKTEATVNIFLTIFIIVIITYYFTYLDTIKTFLIAEIGAYNEIIFYKLFFL